MKHIVKLTLSNPSHEHVSMRMHRKQQDYITEGRDESEAINRAARHFQSLGFKVHSAVIVEQKVELPDPVKAEPLSEAVDYKALEKPTIARIKSGETKPVDRTDYNKPAYLRKKPIDKKAALEAYIARRNQTVTEETVTLQYIEEKLTAADPASKWIHDFVHSDNPKFAGKSKAERIKMALGAKYAAQRNEEVAPEEVDEETKQRKSSVAKDGVGRLAWRAGTADEVKKNHLKVYKKLKSTDPEKAEKFKQNYKIEEEAEQVNEVSNADLRKTDAYKKAMAKIKAGRLEKEYGGKKGDDEGMNPSADVQMPSKSQHVKVDHKRGTPVEVYREETEQVDEANLRHDPEAPLRTTAPVVKTWQKSKEGDPRAKAAWAKHVRRLQKVEPTGMTKKDVEAHMQAHFGEEAEQTDEATKMSRTEWRTGTPAVVAKNHEKIYNKLLATDPAKAKKFLDSVTKKDSVKEAADPGETKVVNKAVKTKKAAVAAEKLVKIAKSKVNKINMDPKLDNDVKQSSRY